MRYKVLRPFKADGKDYDGQMNNLLPVESTNWRSHRSLLNTRRIAAISDEEARELEQAQATRETARQQTAVAAPAATEADEAGRGEPAPAATKPTVQPRRHLTQAELRKQAVLKGAK